MRFWAGFAILGLAACNGKASDSKGDDDDDVCVEDCGDDDDDDDDVEPGVWHPGLAGRTLSAYPHFEIVEAFTHDDAVQTAIDPHRFPGLVGDEIDVYVVTDASDGADLVEVADGPVKTTVVEGSIADNVVDLWTSDLPDGPEVAQRFTVVYDLDGDGVRTNADLVDDFVVLADLRANGPHATKDAEVQQSFWIQQKVYWPKDIDTFDEPAPLVVISHGNGHDYLWYDYLGEHLASWGYVVMSHRNNTEPGPSAAAITTIDNTDALLGSLAAVDSDLVGNVDGDTIGWIGHSRGAEGIVYAHALLRDGTESADNYDPDDIKVLSSIAPTVFHPPTQSEAGDRPLHVIHGAADGDVTGGAGYFGAACPSCQPFRLLQGSTADIHATAVQGATHNAFNCCGINDGAIVNAPQIPQAAVQDISKVLHLALFEHYLRDSDALDDVLFRMPERFGFSGLEGVMATAWKRRSLDRHVIDDFQKNFGNGTSSSGEDVDVDATDAREGPLDDRNGQFAHDPADAMNGGTWSHKDGALTDAGVAFGWDGDASYAWSIAKDDRDWSEGAWLTFTVAQSTRHPNTVALDAGLSFTVTLIDGDEGSSSIDFGVYGTVTTPYKRPGLGPGEGWANEMNTVRIRVSDFETDGSGLDVTDIRTVRFDLGEDFGSPTGRIVVDELAVEVP